MILKEIINQVKWQDVAIAIVNLSPIVQIFVISYG